MRLRYAAFTYEQILPLLLAILLIFIVPMLMRRHGWSWGELFRALFSGVRKRDRNAPGSAPAGKAGGREPHLKNGGRNELIELLSELLRFARRHKMRVVYPGTVSRAGETATLTALLVTGAEVVGINCFGFAGTITAGEGDGSWSQHMNGADIRIPNPRQLNEKQFRLVRRAMDENGMAEVPLRIVGVFTNRNAVLNMEESGDVVTRRALIEDLRRRAAEEERRLDPVRTAEQLNRLVVRRSRNSLGD